MPKTISSDRGIYILELFAKHSFTISAKKFTDFNFPKGYYYYVGSAQKNLNSRLARHLKAEKKIHWHIDHLTTNKSINILNIFIVPEAEKLIEAKIANNFIQYFNAEIIVKGFGNSDTKETITHLFYTKKAISLSNFQSNFQNLFSTKIGLFK